MHVSRHHDGTAELSTPLRYDPSSGNLAVLIHEVHLSTPQRYDLDCPARRTAGARRPSFNTTTVRFRRIRDSHALQSEHLSTPQRDDSDGDRAMERAMNAMGFQHLKGTIQTEAQSSRRRRFQTFNTTMVRFRRGLHLHRVERIARLSTPQRYDLDTRALCVVRRSEQPFNTTTVRFRRVGRLRPGLHLPLSTPQGDDSDFCASATCRDPPFFQHLKGTIQTANFGG